MRVRRPRHIRGVEPAFEPRSAGGERWEPLQALALDVRTVVDKIAAVVLPVSAFVAAGFEHSVANMYFIPLGIFLRDAADLAGIAGADRLDWSGYARNLVPVTLGNVVGGSGLVALVYHVIYRRGDARTADEANMEATTKL